MKKLYLTGIRGVPREALEEAFSKYGKVVKLSTGSQDFGFCDMETDDQCADCAKYCNRTEIGGRIVNVEVAKDMPKKDDEFICYNCKRGGHLARDCHEKPRNPMFSDTRGTKKNDRDEDSSSKSGRFHPYGDSGRSTRPASPPRPAYDRERRYSPDRRAPDPYRSSRPEPRDTYPPRYDDHHRDRSPPRADPRSDPRPDPRADPRADPRSDPRDLRDPYRDPRDYPLPPPRYDDRRPPLDYRDPYRRDYPPPPPRGYYDRRPPVDPYDRRPPPVDPYRRSSPDRRPPPVDDRYRAPQRSPERYRASPEADQYPDRYVADSRDRDRYPPASSSATTTSSSSNTATTGSSAKYSDDKYDKRPTTKRSRSPEKRGASPDRYRSSPAKDRSPVRKSVSPPPAREGSRSPNYRRDRSDRESRFKRSAREERSSTP